MLPLSRALAVASAIALLVVARPAPARADTLDACIDAAEQGQRLRDGARLRAARAAFLSCATAGCPASITHDCERWLAEVDASLPTVVVRVVSADGADIPDARVSIDDEEARSSGDGRAISLDPGVHVVRALHAGSAARASVVVRVGERERRVTLTLAAAGTPAAAPEAPSERRSIPASAWLLGGVGVVGTASAIALWVSGRAERADLYATCGGTRACTGGDETPAKTKLVVGDVLFVAGLATLGAATWIAVHALRTPRRISARVELAPSGVMVRGTF